MTRSELNLDDGEVCYSPYKNMGKFFSLSTPNLSTSLYCLRCVDRSMSRPQNWVQTDSGVCVEVLWQHGDDGFLSTKKGTTREVNPRVRAVTDVYDTGVEK